MGKRLQRPPKAYKDMEFLSSPEARTLRMMAEFLEPQRRFRQQRVKDTIVFFGSSRIKPRSVTLANLRDAHANVERADHPTKALLKSLRDAEIQVEMSRYYEDTVELARLLTRWSKRFENPSRFVVCSGGGPGIMEAANKGARLAGGKTIGLNISIPTEQYPNAYITPGLSFEFHYFFMRKLWFVYLSKALVAFPGGFGTLDELMEVLTLLQTRKLKKKIAVVLYGSEYWNKVIDFRELINHGVVPEDDMALFTFMDTPEDAFRHLKKFLLSTHVNGETL